MKMNTYMIGIVTHYYLQHDWTLVNHKFIERINIFYQARGQSREFIFIRFLSSQQKSIRRLISFIWIQYRVEIKPCGFRSDNWWYLLFKKKETTYSYYNIKIIIYSKKSILSLLWIVGLFLYISTVTQFIYLYKYYRFLILYELSTTTRFVEWQRESINPISYVYKFIIICCKFNFRSSVWFFFS